MDLVGIVAGSIAGWCLAWSAGTAGPELEEVKQAYEAKARPILAARCVGCHSTEKREGELDLERFTSLDAIREDPGAWLKVVEMVSQGEMPPEEAEPITAEEKKELLGWIEGYLEAEAKANAGDPGRVVLRRLTNAEYTYTLRDLTGVPLDPAREFPTDSAAGEGFTNTGNSLVMSPALLQKYLDAGKEVARHAVLLPRGIRFSAFTTRGDWNNEILDQIREIYRRHSEIGGGTSVNLQGVIFNTNDGGRIPLPKYIEAVRDLQRDPAADVATVARAKGLNAKYLGILSKALREAPPHTLLAGVAERLADPDADPTAISEEIARWQQTLTRFQNVGHMKPWMVPTNPIADRVDLRVAVGADVADPAKNPSGIVKVYLAAGDAADGSAGDEVVWERPRLVAPGRPDLLLRDVRSFVERISVEREQLFQSTSEALAAAWEARGEAKVDRSALAAKYGVPESSLATWFDYLGIGLNAAEHLDLFTNELKGVGGYETVTGWGLPETPSVVANSSDNDFHIPGYMKGHGVCVHPAPAHWVAIGWKSPISGAVEIQGKVKHAHPECGNGVVWSLTVQRGGTRRSLAEGIAHGATPVEVGPIPSLHVEAGDLLSFRIGPRDGNHSCDLTEVDWQITSLANREEVWNLAADVSPNILAANPHADGRGTTNVWHFYREPVDAPNGPQIVAGSLLDRWQSAATIDEAKQRADELEKLLVAGPAPEAKPDDPNRQLQRELASMGGPLLVRATRFLLAEKLKGTEKPSAIGLDPERFGKSTDGSAVDPASLGVHAPSVIAIDLPADLAAGSEFVVGASLHPESGKDGSVQVALATEETPFVRTQGRGARPAAMSAIDPSLPVLVQNAGEARGRLERSFDAFRELFPAALCYYKIVPVDEVITLTLFHREDESLRRLMLNEEESRELDRLWEELHFVSRDKLTMVDAFYQLLEYASQDGRPSDFEPFRKPILDGAANFREAQAAAEPAHLAAVVDLARRAFRRPLSTQEEEAFRGLYAKLREQGISHDDAIDLTLARVFVSPAFLYRLESAPEGNTPAQLNDFELASRLSYFLWSSLPDEELLRFAGEGKLREPDVLLNQTRRMMKDDRVRRLAQEFGCQWLQVYDFDTLDEKSERHFPEFVSLRGEMKEEVIRFLTDLFQNDGSLIALFDANHVFVNDKLATFYGIPNVAGDDWRRIEDAKQYGRGGVLGLAATLAKNSGASRTSPILRGTWISEVILGEKLPKPPKNVPILPDEESSTAELTVRQLVEKHTSDPKCANCHRRIDPFGFALENYDAIGRHRTVDLSQHPIDAKTTLPDDAAINGAEELRAYLMGEKRDVVVRQFVRKLLGYSLGRSVQLSDEPLLDEIETKLKGNEYCFSTVVESIVLSPQFRSIRGRATQDVAKD